MHFICTKILRENLVDITLYVWYGEATERRKGGVVNILKKAYLPLLVLLLVVAGCGGSGGESGGDSDPETTTFTSGVNSLTATTTESGGTKTTTIADANGETIVTAAITINGVTLSAPGQSDSVSNTFSTPLSAMPTNFATNVLGAYIAAQVAGYSANITSPRTLCPKDSAGCDWFPDTQCTLGCCADHDACYRMNECSATSWLLIGSSLACINCNGLAEVCILTACIGVTESRSNDRCYDARCGEFYDCGEADCYTCTSPCDTLSPQQCTETVYENCCGNGSCELGETRDNCSGDCAEGDGYNTCCYESDDCPSEQFYSCPGACCCCGSGEVCTQDGTHVCTGSASISAEQSLSQEIKALIKRCEGKAKKDCR